MPAGTNHSYPLGMPERRSVTEQLVGGCDTGDLADLHDLLVDALGGTLQIASSPGNGTTLRAAIPVPHAVPITI
jgi:hypothetical protein